MPVGRPAAHLAVLGSPHTIDSPSHAGSPPTPSPPHADNRPRLLPFRHRLTFRENLTGPDRRRRAVKRAIVPVWGGIPPQTGHERGLLHVGVSAPELDEVRERPAHVKPPVCRLERPARPRSRPLGSPPAPARLSAPGMPTRLTSPRRHLPTPATVSACSRSVIDSRFVRSGGPRPTPPRSQTCNSPDSGRHTPANRTRKGTIARWRARRGPTSAASAPPDPRAARPPRRSPSRPTPGAASRPPRRTGAAPTPRR